MKSHRLGENILYKACLIKTCYPEYTENLKLNNKDMNNPSINWAKELSTISMKIRIWEVSIWKNVQHHIGNYKLKQYRKCTSPDSYKKGQKSKTLATPNPVENVEEQGLITGAGMQNGTATLEDILAFPTKLNISYHTIQQSHSLVFTQVNWKFMAHTKTCTQICLAALFISAKLKQWRCPSVGEWINGIQRKEYYSVLKTNAPIQPWKVMKGT